ncbi:hypothetical protein RHMOL_Rhmol01G0133000 [Rhododendron molle]|uniref:Uncharacterized protein n=2 Tax=Rhododendron molle TaxID=49168 RepID=A0ACC0Q2J3_RHOML|nr:hypothetical protein RHMOL_Rhmol02G0075400 [Rhododendron molle]KAI8571604.1 hypothetical protein RHMOL_Rhmol01G0133000 [Rhododendron molle]
MDCPKSWTGCFKLTMALSFRAHYQKLLWLLFFTMFGVQGMVESSKAFVSQFNSWRSKCELTFVHVLVPGEESRSQALTWLFVLGGMCQLKFLIACNFCC